MSRPVGVGPGQDPPPIAYLDHAATSPLRPEVAEAMAPFGPVIFGNPSGAHRMARAARTALDDARQLIADLLGFDAGEVVFTSGGTESDNLAVFGVLAAVPARDGGRAVVCSAVEHAAVLEPCRAAAKGFGGAARSGVGSATAVDLREAPVDSVGRLDLDGLTGLLDERVVLVSVMAANSEVGTIQPLAQVAELVRRLAPTAVLHTDAVQALSYLDVGSVASGFDLVSVSAHKLGGPKGSGALLVRSGTPLQPLLFGGGQERERRSGTPDVAGAVGLATALATVTAGREAESSRIGSLRDQLASRVGQAVPGVCESVPASLSLPGHCHLRVDGVDSEELLLLLDDAGVCASAGSACASGALEPSHVLRAMGVPPDQARGAVRFSFGWTSSQADVDQVVRALPPVVARLRS